jgi:alginate O-acetyltransferase complex protein AlgI
VAWVFFRAKSLTEAEHYLAAMFGFAPLTAAADAVAGAIYTPYHRSMFALAAVLAFAAPTTWAFTERLSAPRAASALAMLALSVLLMWTQTVNPFLYFQF